MRTLHGLATFGAVMTTLAFSGCTSCSSTSDTLGDGVECGATPASQVFVEVGYEPDGTPTVGTEECHVNPTTTITWRGPPADDTAFEIDFKAASADARMQDPIPSEDIGGRQKAIIQAQSTVGEYAYSIKSGKKELDPVVIIEP